MKYFTKAVLLMAAIPFAFIVLMFGITIAGVAVLNLIM